MDSLILNISLPVGVAALENYIIYANGGMPTYTTNPMLPPGYIVGIVWIILLGSLGYAHYLLYNLQGGNTIASSSVIVLILYCLSYPILIYYNTFKEKELNIFSLCITSVASLITFMTYPTAFAAMLPTLVWISYVELSDIIYP